MNQNDDSNKPSSPPEDGWDAVIDERPPSPPRVHTLPIGTPRPATGEPADNGPGVQKSATVRLPMESAIELDDDSIVEVEEHEVVIKPVQPPAKPPVPTKPLIKAPAVPAVTPAAPPVVAAVTPAAPPTAPANPSTVPLPPSSVPRISMSPVSRRPDALAPAPAPALAGHEDELVAELARRAQDLEDKDVPVALSRARVELGIVLEVFAQDREEALAQYHRAHEAVPDAEAPLLAARWLTPSRPLAPALKLAVAHARIASDDVARVERAVQVADLHRSAGMLEEARAGFRQALSIKPTHPAALRGQEGVLQALHRAGAPGSARVLAEHLEDMASAFAAEPRLAAWMHVERAALLDGERKHDAARAALELAVKLDGTDSSVRAAYTRHLLLQRATDALVSAWALYAEQESDQARAARCEYAAARLCSERLDDVNRAISLLSRAAAREDANADVRRDALQELARLHGELGNPRAASEARERHLALVEDPARRCHEHRRLAQAYETLGQHEDVVRHALQILASDPGDTATRDRLDRSLDALERHEERIDRWNAESAHAVNPVDRAEALVRAARIAEQKLHDLDRAEFLYRAAWATDSFNVDAFDGLARLLARPGSQPGQVLPEHARARIDLYEQAAVASMDKERRIACLQKVAHIWEDELNQPSRALEVYRRLADLDGTRRATILGLQRCAGLASEYDVLVGALVREAETAQDPGLQRYLLLRAAGLAADELNDADTAMSLLGRVLSRSPGDPLALRAAWRVNHKTGRYEQALEQLRLLLRHTRRGPAAFALCIEMALLLEEQLRRPQEAVKAYQEAAAQDREHPTPTLEIPRILLGLGEYRKAADQLVELAGHASNPYVRARLLVQAADIYDDRLDDLDAAIIALTQARALVPADAAIFERTVRVQERRGKPTELIPLLDKRIAETQGGQKLALQFQLADLLARERDYARAATLLRDVLSADPHHVAALRLLEHALRRLEGWEELASLLHRQAEVFGDSTVRLGALFEARYLEELGTGGAEPSLATLDQIRSITPDDPFVDEAIVRAGGLGSPRSARGLADALTRMASKHTQDSFMAAILHLGAALQLETLGIEEDASATAQALIHYQACLDSWPKSLTAARGLLRVAQTLGDIPSEVKAHSVLGKIESSAKDRAYHNASAGESLAAQGEEGRSQALDLFANSLSDDPDCAPAARGLVDLVGRGVDAGRVADLLRTALDHAHERDQVVLVGGALGRIATEHLKDLNGAVEALRRVREKAPGHVPTLLDLAEACVALRLWFEAAEVAQSVLGISNDRAEHIRALVVLAESHANVQAKWADARREAVDAELASEALPLEERRSTLLRLSRVYETLKDSAEQERLICMNVALAGADLDPLRQLAARHDLSAVEGAIAYIQSLNRVVAMAEVLGVPRQPSWLVELGRLEALRLSRPREGISKIREAIALDPSRIDSSLALADTLSTMGAHEESAAELRSMLGTIDPSTLTSEKVATIMAMAKRELESSSRRIQAQIAEEIMGFLGYGAPERLRFLRSRVMPETIPQPMAFDRAMLERTLVPPVGQGPLLRVAAALEDIAHKLLRIEPAGVGATSAMRHTSRSSHPRRIMADRLARAFGSVSFDLYVDVPSLTSPRMLPGDPPCILLPPGYENLPYNEQAVGLSRFLSAIALGVPWIGEISDEDLVGWIFGALAVGRPGWDGGGLHPAKEALASVWRPLIHKHVSRKSRRSLDEVAEEVSLTMDPIAWRHAMRLASWRGAFVISGDWTSTINHVWRSERELVGIAPDRVAATLFGHSVLRDLALWGLSPETTPLLRAAGHP